MTHTHHIEVELKRFRVTTTITLDRRILDEAFVALEQATPGRPPVAAGCWYQSGPGRLVRVAAGVAVAAAVAVVLLGLASWQQVAAHTDWGVLFLFGGGLTLSTVMLSLIHI